MRIFLIKICWIILIFTYILHGCVTGKPKLLMYGDGTMEDKRFVIDYAHATSFRIPSGNWGMKNIRYHAQRYGQGRGNEKQIVLTICDENLNTLFESRVNHGYVDTNIDKWYTMAISPPLYHPGEIWVFMDTNSTQSEGIFMGIDTTVDETHSKMGMPGGPLTDLEGNFDWMIRVELVKLSSEEMEKLRTGESNDDEPS
jgi:hypothetical protein